MLLQAEIHRVIQMYHLSTTKDLNISMAITDILSRHGSIPRDRGTERLLRAQISKAIAYKKYYNRKK